MEMVINCDIVVASEDAKFGLPEVKRGVVAIQGGTVAVCLAYSLTHTRARYPKGDRSFRTAGTRHLNRNRCHPQCPSQLASELLLTGNPVSAQDARDRFRL